MSLPKDPVVVPVLLDFPLVLVQGGRDSLCLTTSTFTLSMLHSCFVFVHGSLNRTMHSSMFECGRACIRHHWTSNSTLSIMCLNQAIMTWWHIQLKRSAGDSPFHLWVTYRSSTHIFSLTSESSECLCYAMNALQSHCWCGMPGKFFILFKSMFVHSVQDGIYGLTIMHHLQGEPGLQLSYKDL